MGNGISNNFRFTKVCGSEETLSLFNISVEKSETNESFVDENLFSSACEKFPLPYEMLFFSSSFFSAQFFFVVQLKYSIMRAIRGYVLHKS